MSIKYNHELNSVEKKIITLLIDGKTQKEVSQKLQYHERSIRLHMNKMKTTFNARTTIELIYLLVASKNILTNKYSFNHNLNS